MKHTTIKLLIIMGLSALCTAPTYAMRPEESIFQQWLARNPGATVDQAATLGKTPKEQDLYRGIWLRRVGLPGIQAQIAQQTEVARRAQQNVTDLQRQLTALLAERDRLVRERRTLDAEFEALGRQVADLTARLNQAESERNAAVIRINELEKDAAYWKQETDDSLKIVAQFRRDLDALQQETTQKGTLITTLRQELAELREQTARIEKLEQELQTALRKNIEQGGQIAVLNDQLLVAQAAQAKAEQQAQETVKAAYRMATQMLQLEEELAATRGKTVDLEGLGKRADAAERANRALTTEIAQVRQDLERTQRDLATTQTAVRKTAGMDRRIKDLQTENDRLWQENTELKAQLEGKPAELPAKLIEALTQTLGAKPRDIQQALTELNRLLQQLLTAANIEPGQIFMFLNHLNEILGKLGPAAAEIMPGVPAIDALDAFTQSGFTIQRWLKDKGLYQDISLPARIANLISIFESALPTLNASTELSVPMESIPNYLKVIRALSDAIQGQPMPERIEGIEMGVAKATVLEPQALWERLKQILERK